MGVDGGVKGEVWRALNSKQHPLAENPRRARKQWYNRGKITGKEKICTFLTKAHSWNFTSTARWWQSRIVLSGSCWLSLACFFPHLHGGHYASCLRIHYLFVYRPQLPAPALDVIWAVFFLFSFFYVILLFPHSLFGPELFPLFFFSFRLTHFTLFIPLAVYFIMQKLQNRNLFSFTLSLYM